MSESDSLQTVGSPYFWSGSPTCLQLPWPSFVRLGSGLLLSPGFPFRGSISVCPAAVFRLTSAESGIWRISQVLDASFHAYHAL